MPSRQSLLLLFAMAATGQANSGEPIKVVPTPLPPAKITLDIDASGLASGFACKPPLAAPTCAAVIAAASRWQYRAGQADGKPAAMKAIMTLHLQAVPKAGGFVLRAVAASIREVGVPADETTMEIEQPGPLRYPPYSRRWGKEALVVLEAWPVPGTDRLTVRNAWLNGKSPPKRGSDLVDAATEAAGTWSVKARSPKALSLCIPVVFSLKTLIPSDDLSPCVPTYTEGYMPPELLTKPAQMAF